MDDNTKPKILVVEDEVGLLEIIGLNLEAAGYEVVTATDGLEAWRKYEEEQPDLVVLDLHLPTVSGFRVLEFIKGEPNPAPVLVLTALDFAEAESLTELGLEAFITKPFEPEKVVETVRHLLATRGATDGG